jgi:hypothetical protein
MPRNKRQRPPKRPEHKRLIAIDWPRFTDFTACEWIESTTYRRIRFVDRHLNPENGNFPVGTEIECIVWQPPMTQILRKCDNCVRYHRSTNINCSASLRRRYSFLDAHPTLFVFKTQKPVRGQWRLISSTRAWRSPMEKETYMRIA